MKNGFKIKDIKADIYIAGVYKDDVAKLTGEISKLYNAICDIDKLNNSLYSITNTRECYLSDKREELVTLLKSKQNELMNIIKDNMVMEVPEYNLLISPQDINEYFGIDRNVDVASMLGKNTRPLMFNGI